MEGCMTDQELAEAYYEAVAEGDQQRAATLALEARARGMIL